MAWKCPACTALILHADEATPLGALYRCPVCRLELVVDDRADAFVGVGPLERDVEAPASKLKSQR